MAESTSALSSQLAELDAAISAVVSNGQAIASDGTSYTRANLEALYKRRDMIQRRLESAQAVVNGRNRLFARTRITGIGDL